MSILVTGGVGFIGSNFLHHLVKEIEYVDDRLGHDHRYFTDISKIRLEIKWSPKFNLDIGLDKTISWYFENKKRL